MYIEGTCRQKSYMVHSEHLADVPCTIACQGPVAVVSARGLANSCAIDLERDPEVASVSKLCASRDAHLATAVDSSAIDPDIVAVLNQDSVVAVVGKVNSGDSGTTRFTDAEDATTATARLDPVNVYVGVVVAVCVASVAVGEAKCAIAGASTDVVAVDKADLDVDRVLEQQARLADIAGNNLINGQAVNVPGLDSVAV